jgi:outer membrane protein assembly factor BamE (lipoprotein component of BamABCDE complex)|tara:strand:- start:132 stop:539 length:408 start_codon:yes stop_codon:yes gene_type:complete
MKKSVDHHGVHMLEKKTKELTVNIDNKNDIIKLLGPASVESSFDNDVMFYIERKIGAQGILKLGKQKILVNNVLMVEVDNRGILVKKEFFDLNEMKEIKLVVNETNVDYKKTSFVYDFLSSMRQKINDPLGKRKK